MPDSRSSFWTHLEAAEFSVTQYVPNLVEQIKVFYLARGVRRFTSDDNVLRFARGSVLGSLFGPLAAHRRQRFEIRIEETEQGRTVRVRCEFLGLFPILAPESFQLEVQELEGFIRDTSRLPAAWHEAAAHGTTDGNPTT
jgi:hypothetical protein